ncbi:hypothetical protein ACLSJW_01345 [Weissella cibaria]|uniref:hypothetical protein n=1 Tax=Weissella cibaria TaxID=137591 RepID=UPI0039A6ABFC
MLTSFLVLELTALVTLVWAIKFKISKLTIWTFIAVTVLNAIYVYWLMPVPTLSQLVSPVAIETTALVLWTLFAGASAQVVERVTKRGSRISFAGLTIWPFVIPIVAFVISLAAGISQAVTVRPMYDSVKATVKKEAPLTKDDQPIALSAQASQNMMKKAFSQVPDSSMYRLGDLSAQYINGKPYYVAPVEFAGFMSWFMNRTLPGYFIISATDINDTAHFVKEKLDYSETSCSHIILLAKFICAIRSLNKLVNQFWKLITMGNHIGYKPC